VDNRLVGDVALASEREWSYHWRIAPDGRGFDSPQLHQQLLIELIDVAPTAINEQWANDVAQLTSKQRGPTKKLRALQSA